MMHLSVCRAFFLAVALLAGPVRAQEQNQTLPIPVPPNARINVEVDAQHDDLLGVVKSLLKGFNGQTLRAMMEGPQGAGGPSAGGPGMAGTPAPGSGEATFARMLADVNLAEVLKDINHLHLVMYTPAGGTVGGAAGGRPAPV